jgi:hypothetical protein
MGHFYFCLEYVCLRIGQNFRMVVQRIHIGVLVPVLCVDLRVFGKYNTAPKDDVLLNLSSRGQSTDDL